MEEEVTFPFPNDNRHIREQVNDHPFLSVNCLILLHSEDGGKTMKLHTEKWEYEWFDTEDALVEYVDELKSWATKDCEDNGDTQYAVVAVETGWPLTVRHVSSHGYASQKFKDAVVEFITKNPDVHLFEGMDDPAIVAKMKAARQEGLVKKALSKRKKAEPEAKPVVRARGSRKVAAAPSGNSIQPKARRVPNQNRKVISSDGAPKGIEVKSDARKLALRGRQNKAS